MASCAPTALRNDRESIIHHRTLNDLLTVKLSPARREQVETVLRKVEAQDGPQMTLWVSEWRILAEALRRLSERLTARSEHITETLARAAAPLN